MVGLKRVLLRFVISVCLDSRRAARAADMAVDLLLMRHGQSQNNVFPRQGWLGLTDPVLSPTGREQALLSGKCLSALTTPNLTFSSVLRRAQETALIANPDAGIVHVAPYVSEMHWGSPFLHPGSTPLPRAEQEAWAAECRSSGEWTPPLNFSWAPPQSECGPPNWEQFISWLWQLAEVQASITASLAIGTRPVFLLTSHGRFLDGVMQQHGFDNKGNPHNTQVFRAELPLVTDQAGQPQGFGDMIVKGVACPGFPDGPYVFLWCLTIGVVFCCCCIACISVGAFLTLSRKGRIESRSWSRNKSNPWQDESDEWE